MGQAFDRDGQILGEAEAATKREVFDKLIQKHPDAHEIRIRSLREERGLGGQTSRGHLDPTIEKIHQESGERMLTFFKSDHLPDNLREVSVPFGQLACQIVTNLPRNAERTVALRKLLEAKDCAVRASLEGA